VESQITTVIAPTTILAGLLSAWPLVMAVAMIALFLGAFSPSRRIGALLSTVVFLIGYFGSNLAGMVESIEPLEPFFLFTYYDATSNLLINGPEAGDMLVLLVVAAIFLLLAALFFQLRNLTVGTWPWQRGRMPD
jgi:hypothetical protein